MAFYIEAVPVKLLCVYVAVIRLYPALERKKRGKGTI